MKRICLHTFVFVFIGILLCGTAAAEPLLVPVGQAIGLELRDNTVTIAAFDDILGQKAKASGLKIGDQIIRVNGKPVKKAEDIQNELLISDAPVTLAVRRGSKELSMQLSPTHTDSGTKLGIYLKQGITGIGTVTWYNPSTGQFGALGHGVNDSGGVLMRMANGVTYPAEVDSVNRGQSGHPGQLRGNCHTADICGNLLKNTPQGVFGKSPNGWPGEPVPIGTQEQLHTGSASIRATVCGNQAKDYSIEILKIYPANRSDGRNMLLKITDSSLLDATGGIVQGMSGSPILQDGRLIGAVTHVLVNDPTMGYGIFIGNMLEAAA